MSTVSNCANLWVCRKRNFLKTLSRVEQFENDTFFVLVWTENFLYPQLFEYADVILSCNLSSQVINMAKNMIF